MGRATEILREEHRLIARAAACLERIGDDAKQRGELCVVSAVDLLEFFEHYVDAAHQEKEERVLFPALLRGGLAPPRIQHLLEEHREDRKVLRSLRQRLEGAAYGDGLSLDGFVFAAERYAAHQREHAAEEDRVLLPLADELLEPAAEHRVLVGFRRIDATLRRPATEYSLLVAHAESRFGSTRALPAWCASGGAG